MYTTPNTVFRDSARGGRLREQMDLQGMSIAELARECGVDRRTISGIVSGKRDGNMATWLAVARALGFGLDDIVDV